MRWKTAFWPDLVRSGRGAVFCGKGGGERADRCQQAAELSGDEEPADRRRQVAESSCDEWRRFHLVAIGGAFILIVYNSWNKDEIPLNQAAQRGCSSQTCLLWWFGMKKLLINSSFSSYWIELMLLLFQDRAVTGSLHCRTLKITRMLLRVMLQDSFRRGSRIWNSKNTTNFIQMDSQVIRNGFLWDICEIYRDHGRKNSDHYTITILSEV